MTSTRCVARLRVHYKAKKGKYVVSIFVDVNNHELTSSKFVHSHPIYLQISKADGAQIYGLQSHGIKTCYIIGYMAQKGGYNDVGFIKKDFYNYFDKKTCDVIKDGDVVVALNYPNVKSSDDPMIYAEYSVNIDGRLKSLFWAYDTNRLNYLCFGDVVVFDITY